ncbi:hypothetical protein VST7929_02919 [Vibrio stylophorae]|uniref:Uncharacterized protein n=1 Tax=Vibrio stylophorae TaxID=659351 RepID=A0ABM8ZX90_9VIBR|nr:hypothetical protein [Vibrio stylophorae]CAH0535308.1 hypothetical protein VST7929_02919 [Vibrio stylophorae]
MEWKIRIFIALLVAGFPSIAYANGGGPLLLFISGSAFICGQVWILLVETVLLNRASGLGGGTAFKHVFWANLVSTIIVGFGFPLALAIITGFGMALPEPYADYSSAIGTWLYDRAPYGKYLIYISMVWLFITFLLTIYCEKAFYNWYWRKVGFSPCFSIDKFIWQAHAVSYSGLLIMVLLMWHELFSM